MEVVRAGICANGRCLNCMSVVRVRIDETRPAMHQTAEGKERQFECPVCKHTVIVLESQFSWSK